MASLGILVIGIATGASASGSSRSSSAFAGIVAFALSIYIIVCTFKYNFLLSKSFGKGTGFCVGLVFLSVIFHCILAFSRNTHYEGGSPEAASPVSMQATSETAFTPSAPQTAPPMKATVFTPAVPSAQLIGRAGVLSQKTISVTGTSVLGRSHSANVQIDDATISAMHCQIGWRNSKLFLTDLGSSNVTSVEGFGTIPPHVPVELRNGDLITISRNNIFEVRM